MVTSGTSSTGSASNHHPPAMACSPNVHPRQAEWSLRLYGFTPDGAPRGGNQEFIGFPGSLS